jgi:hypothetical protein
VLADGVAVEAVAMIADAVRMTVQPWLLANRCAPWWCWSLITQSCTDDCD